MDQLTVLNNFYQFCYHTTLEIAFVVHMHIVLQSSLGLSHVCEIQISPNDRTTKYKKRSSLETFTHAFESILRRNA